MASFMPTIPKIFFCYIEPALTFFGALQPLLKPSSLTSMLPPDFRIPSSTPTAPLTPLETHLSYQNSHYLLLLTLISLIIFFSATPAAPSRRTVHLYVAALALADIPHWLGILAVLGGARGGVGEGSLNYVRNGWERGVLGGQWTPGIRAMFWAPCFTAAMKVLYLVGAFGEDRVDVNKKANVKM